MKRFLTGWLNPLDPGQTLTWYFVIADLHRAPPVWRHTLVEMCRPRSLGNTTELDRLARPCKSRLRATRGVARGDFGPMSLAAFGVFVSWSWDVPCFNLASHMTARKFGSCLAALQADICGH